MLCSAPCSLIILKAWPASYVFHIWIFVLFEQSNAGPVRPATPLLLLEKAPQGDKVGESDLYMDQRQTNGDKIL